MAKRKRRHQRQSDGVIGHALRPVAWSALLGAALTTAATAAPAQASPLATNVELPAYAEPSRPGQAPDAGARPIPAGPVVLPGGGTQAPPTTAGPPVTAGVNSSLAAQISALEAEVESLGEQAKQADIERGQARNEADVAAYAWRSATDALRTAEETAKIAAEKAYKQAAGLPPGTTDSELHGLGALWPVQPDASRDKEVAASELLRAQEAERAAYRVYKDALTRRDAAETKFVGLNAKRTAKEATLERVRKRNADQLAVIERAREAADQRLGRDYVGGDTVAGMKAHPKAVAAMRFALAQLGEPYQWGAEGPSRWDCSGLMWGAYSSVGYNLPRVSRDQYAGTRTNRVSRYALLPGDLLFFSSSPTDARSIHHVGMYIGNGKMVHAPTTGDVVKISTVWWSRFYDATRVFGAVPAPQAPPPAPAPPPPPAPGPKPTTPKPTPPKPTPTKPTPTTPAPTTPAPTTPAPTPTTPKPEPTTQAPKPTETQKPDPAPSPTHTAPPTTAPATASPTGG